MNGNIKDTRRNVMLDFLRILAITQIFLMHLTIFIPEVAGNQIFAVLSKLSSRGGNLVAVLFCLSGYLIFRELAEKQTDLKSYYKKRMTRIVPAYYLILICYIVVGLLPFNYKVLPYFFFVNGIVPSDHYDLYNNMGGFWTMGVFMFWYLIAPWAAKKIKSLKSALLLLVGTFAVAQVLQVVLEYLYTGLDADEPGFMVGNNPVGNMYFFAAGVVAYYIIKEKKVYKGILACMAGIAFFSVLNSPWYPYWTLIAMVFIMLSGEIRLTLPNRLDKIVVFASNVSFDFYLVHLGVMELLNKSGIFGGDGLLFVVCATILAVFAAVAVYCLEVKVLKPLCGKMLPAL